MQRYGGGRAFRHDVEFGQILADLIRALKLRKVESAGKYRDTIGDLNASLTKVALEELLQLDAPEYDG